MNLAGCRCSGAVRCRIDLERSASAEEKQGASNLRGLGTARPTTPQELWRARRDAPLAAALRAVKVDRVTTRDYLWPMKVVGIKQLKARLSEYVRLAKAGETVLVTERDEVVAELRPARRQVPVADRLEELLEALSASGEITRAAQPKGDWTWRSPGLGLPSGTAQALLDELRQERS